MPTTRTVTKTVTDLSVFVSSAGDTSPERQVLKDVAKEINESIGQQLDVFLMVRLWEDMVDFTQPAQSTVQPVGENDVFVGILRHRIGTLLPAEFGNQTGVEWEFDSAIRSFRSHGTPEILVYACRKSAPVSADSLAQLRHLAEFKSKLKQTGLFFTEYADPKDLSRALFRDLANIVSKFAGDSGRANRPTDVAKVFISYSRSSADDVQAISGGLAGLGIKALYDTSALKGGDDWVQWIADAVQSSKVVILIASRSALNSKWVRRELEFADLHEIPIVPVVLEEVKWPGWYELQFGRRNRLEFVEKDFTKIVPSIAEVVRSTH